MVGKRKYECGILCRSSSLGKMSFMMVRKGDLFVKSCLLVCFLPGQNVLLMYMFTLVSQQSDVNNIILTFKLFKLLMTLHKALQQPTSRPKICNLVSEKMSRTTTTYIITVNIERILPQFVVLFL